MPTYEFLHRSDDCNHEWEEILHISDPDPEECPKCHEKGNIIHLISGGSGKGIVQLEGDELVAKVKADAQKLKEEAHRDPNVYANLIGPDRYQQIQTKLDQQKRDGVFRRR
jgi:putative FmdB family regulatory protein